MALLSYVVVSAHASLSALPTRFFLILSRQHKDTWIVGMWKFNNVRHLHQFWVGEEIVFSVTVEAWDDFRLQYGGEYYRHNGVSIIVPPYTPLAPRLTVAYMEELVSSLIMKDRL